MDPILLFSSMFILFFFGFNADSFLGTDQDTFTAQSLIERATKSFCGSTMIYGLSHFAGISWELYRNETPQLEQKNISLAATAHDGLNQLDVNTSDEVPMEDDRQWKKSHYGPHPSPYHSELFEAPPETQALHMSSPGGGPFSTYPYHVLLQPAVRQIVNEASRSGNMDAYLTKQDFVVFLLYFLLPALVLWSTRRPKKSAKRTEDATSDFRPTSYLHGDAGDTSSDFSFAHDVFSAYGQTPQVSELSSNKLDEIFAFTRVAENTSSQPETVSMTEFESLRKFLNTAVEAQAQDLGLLRHGQERIQRQMCDSKAVEEIIKSYFRTNAHKMGCSCQIEALSVNTEDLKERLEGLEERNLDLTECYLDLFAIIEKPQQTQNEGFVYEIKAQKELVEMKLNRYGKIIDTFDERLKNTLRTMNNRLEKIEQAQNQVSVLLASTNNLQDLGKRTGKASPELTNRLDHLEKRIIQLNKEVQISFDPNTKCQMLTRRVAQLQEHELISSDWVARLAGMEEKLSQDSILLNGSFQQTLKTHDENIDKLKGKVNKIEIEQQEVGKIQKTLKTQDEGIGTLKGKVGKIETEQQDVSKIQKEQDEEISSLKEKVDKIERERQDVDKIQQKLHTHDTEIDTLKGEIDKVESEQQVIGERIRQILTEQSSDIDEMTKNLEENVNKRINEKTSEMEAGFTKEFTGLRDQVDLLKDSSRGQDEKYKHLSSQLTVQEEGQLDTEIRKFNQKLRGIEQTVESLLRRSQETQGIDDFDDTIRGIIKESESIQTVLLQMKNRVCDQVLYEEDPVKFVSKQMYDQLVQCEIDIDTLGQQLDWIQKELNGEDPIGIDGQLPMPIQPTDIPANINEQQLGQPPMPIQPTGASVHVNELQQLQSSCIPVSISGQPPTPGIHATNTSANLQLNTTLAHMPLNGFNVGATPFQRTDAPANVNGQSPAFAQPNNAPVFNINVQPPTPSQPTDAQATVSAQSTAFAPPSNVLGFKANSDDPFLTSGETMELEDVMDYAPAKSIYYSDEDELKRVVGVQDDVVMDETVANVNYGEFLRMEIFDDENEKEPLQKSTTNCTAPTGHPPRPEHLASVRQEEVQLGTSLSQSRWAGNGNANEDDEMESIY